MPETVLRTSRIFNTSNLPTAPWGKLRFNHRFRDGCEYKNILNYVCGLHYISFGQCCSICFSAGLLGFYFAHLFCAHLTYNFPFFLLTPPAGSLAAQQSPVPGGQQGQQYWVPLLPPLWPDSVHPFILSLHSPNSLLLQEIIDTSLLESAGKR